MSFNTNAISNSMMGNTLYDNCKVNIQVYNGKKFEDLEITQIVGFFECTAYILGWMDGNKEQFDFDKFMASKKTSVNFYPQFGCTEKKSFDNDNYNRLSLRKIIETFISYLDSNPEASHVPASMGLAYAFLTNYPCE